MNSRYIFTTKPFKDKEPIEVINQSGVKCKSCGDEIFSNNRHDFKYCSCQSVYVDGGLDYLRVGFDKATEYEDITRKVYKYARD